MRRLLGTTVAALGFAAALHAQAPATRRASSPPPAPPAPPPRVGYAASPAPPQAPQAQIIQPTYFYAPNGYYMTGASFLVLADGSVLVNFGNGYERVLRACASPGGVSQSQQDATGRDALGRILPPPGIAALAAGSRGQITGFVPARNAAACYRADGRGGTEVVTTVY